MIVTNRRRPEAGEGVDKMIGRWRFVVGFFAFSLEVSGEKVGAVKGNEGVMR